MSYQQYVSIDSGNGLVSNRRLDGRLICISKAVTTEWFALYEYICNKSVFFHGHV